MKDKHIRLSSEQYIIDENNCITIPYSVLYNAGLGGVPEFNIMEKSDEEYVFSIIPSTDAKEGWEFVQKVNCSEETGIKIDVTGMFELKPGDSVSVDVYEFELFLFDRVSVLKTKRELEEDDETGLDAGKIDWSKELDKLEEIFNKGTKEVKDPYAPDENTIEMMGENLHKKFGDLAKKCKNLNTASDYNDLIENPPSLEELDAMFGNILKEIVNNSNKKLHRSKDPLLNEFIDDMLARVYGRDGQKVVMIHTDELDQFVKDMTYWYKRIKNSK